MPETENVWTEHPQLQAVGHRSTDRITAACGAPVLEWPIAAGHLAVLCGTLCPLCWPNETPAGDEPAGDEEGTV